MKFLFFLLLSLAFVLPASAAEIYFGIDREEMVVGDTFEVGVFLRSDGQSINALEGGIIIPDELSVAEIRDGNSLVPLWIERPSVVGDQVTFAGVLPGGYQGEEAYLFSIIFKAQTGGQATIAAAKEQILLNDGLGTAAPTRSAPLKLTIADSGPSTKYAPPLDNRPPEPFQPVIGQSELPENKIFLAFVAQDKGSGVDHYEFYRSYFQYTPAKALKKDWKWQKIQSPQNIEDKDLKKYLYVKAVDRAGNATVAVVLPQKGLSTYQKVIFCGIIPVVLLILSVWIWSKRKIKPALPLKPIVPLKKVVRSPKIVRINSKRRKNGK